MGIICDVSEGPDRTFHFLCRGVLRGQDGGPDKNRISTRLIAFMCCVLGIGRDSWSSRGVIHGRLSGESGRGPETPDGGGVGVGPDEDIMEPYDVDRGLPRER
jgi:hypothetical protein